MAVNKLLVQLACMKLNLLYNMCRQKIFSSLVLHELYYFGIIFSRSGSFKEDKKNMYVSRQSRLCMVHQENKAI